jgi:hypothetical protein
MTPIADMVEAMLSQDVAAELIVLAVQTAELSRDMSRDKTVTRREGDRLRQRRRRMKLQQNQREPEANDAGTDGAEQLPAGRDSHGVTGNRCDLSSLLSKESTEEGSKKVVVARARGTRLLPGATLSPEDRQFALDHGVTDPGRAWAEFIDYWISVPGQRGTKLDWSATWRNRVRSIGSSRGNYGKTGNVIDAADRLIQRIADFDKAPDESGVRGGTGENLVRLLPPGRSERS